MSTEPELIEAEEGAVQKYNGGSLAILNRSEIEQQVATAKAYPRSLKKFVAEVMDMATLTEKVAEECFYALPRAGKSIEGPSARFAEILASSWGNCRVQSRIIDIDDRYVTAQGAFFDVEKNVIRTKETKRRITDKHGRRYNDDMIVMTSNAACSIAARNATLEGVPKAVWAPIFEIVRQTAIGTAETLVNKRAVMIAYFQKMGVTEAQILATLEVPGLEDIGLDELARLKGVATALKDGDTTIEEQFRVPEPEVKTGKGTAGLKDKIKEKATPAAEATPAQALLDAAKETLKKAGVEKTPEKKPEPEKKAPEDAPGSTISTPAESMSGTVSVIATLLQGAANIQELDNIWKREVEGGELEKVDKKKLAYIYQAANVKLRNS